MLHFECDYLMGAHPKLLERLMKTNMEALSGYGSDHYTGEAKEKLRAVIGRPEAQIHFLTGGTQTNRIVIGSMLRSYEGVIAATTGHVSVHEAGAIEASGHKVLTLPGKDGKLEADTVRNYIRQFYSDPSYTHMVFPGMVYISHPTEYGTLYTRAELEALSQVCKEAQIPLYLDGARLGYGLMSKATDVTIRDIADLCDVFYIGGTKCGALCGEALVFPKGNDPKHLFTVIKQNGALLAKGRLTAIQFDALFTDDLYFKICAQAIDMAGKLKELFRQKGYPFFLDSPTNQQFVILDHATMERLRQQVRFEFWEPVDDDHSAVRFCTSWATTEADLQALATHL